MGILGCAIWASCSEIFLEMLEIILSKDTIFPKIGMVITAAATDPASPKADSNPLLLCINLSNFIS